MKWAIEFRRLKRRGLCSHSQKNILSQEQQTWQAPQMNVQPSKYLAEKQQPSLRTLIEEFAEHWILFIELSLRKTISGQTRFSRRAETFRAKYYDYQTVFPPTRRIDWHFGRTPGGPATNKTFQRRRKLLRPIDRPSPPFYPHLNQLSIKINTARGGPTKMSRAVVNESVLYELNTKTDIFSANIILIRRVIVLRFAIRNRNSFNGTFPRQFRVLFAYNRCCTHVVLTFRSVSPPFVCL